MIAIPFPFFIAEIVIFWFAVDKWGFLNTLGIYLLPCLLGFIIVSSIGRVAMMTMQSTVMRGQLPGNKILHSGAIFLSGILFMVPSFFARVVAIILLLPGLRHLAIWRFKIFMAKKMASGSARVFNFGSGPFGFGTGMGGGPGGMGGMGNQGFRYYEFRNDGTGFHDVGEEREEREIHDAEVFDVTPIEIAHEEKKTKDE